MACDRSAHWCACRSLRTCVNVQPGAFKIGRAWMMEPPPSEQDSDPGTPLTRLKRCLCASHSHLLLQCLRQRIRHESPVFAHGAMQWMRSELPLPAGCSSPGAASQDLITERPQPLQSSLWLACCSHHQPHEALCRIPPAEYRVKLFLNLYF